MEEGLLRKIQEKREAISWQVNIEVDPLRLASRGGIRTKACLKEFRSREEISSTNRGVKLKEDIKVEDERFLIFKRIY